MINVNIKLSELGIKEATKKFESLANNMLAVREEFMLMSLLYIEKRAKKYIRESVGSSSWYELTNTLENSFMVDVKLGTLINNCAYAAFVEFGTGIVGAGTHPMPDGYEYDTNGHGDNGWFFYDESGTIHFTKGMKAHRYMYDAVNDYTKGEYKKIFNRAFKKIIGG